MGAGRHRRPPYRRPYRVSWRDWLRRDKGDSLDGCEGVNFADPRYLTRDEDREGYLVPSTLTDEAPADTRTDERAFVVYGRGERVG